MNLLGYTSDVSDDAGGNPMMVTCLAVGKYSIPIATCVGKSIIDFFLKSLKLTYCSYALNYDCSQKEY